MQDLAALARAARGLRGIFCDVDDTLTHDGVLVPAAYEAIARARDAGLRVVPVTGRPAGWAAVIAATWPVDAAIAENGAVYFRRDGRVVTARYWQSDAEREAARPKLETIRDAVLTHVPRARLATDQWLRRCDLAFDIGETQRLPDDVIAEMARLVTGAGANVTRSTIHLHVVAGDWDKARMCVRLARELFGEDLDATREHWLFVGDSPNDQPCFGYFPLSAGVANVQRFIGELHPPPSFVATREGGHGFAEVVNAVLASL
jgi:HAD superfamily hydrolase (TIGR01484 family)